MTFSRLQFKKIASERRKVSRPTCTWFSLHNNVATVLGKYRRRRIHYRDNYHLAQLHATLVSSLFA